MYHESVWLMYGEKVTGSDRQIRVAVRQHLTRLRRAVDCSERRVEPGGLELGADGRRRLGRPGIGRVVHHVELERRAERRVVVLRAPVPVESRRLEERGRLVRHRGHREIHVPRRLPIAVVDVDDVGAGTVVVGEPVDAGM